MGMFQYVVVLTSIIIGLALAHLAKGLASLIQHPGRVRVWWVHLVWVAYMFLTTLFWWWWEFRYHNIKTWTVQLYLFVIGYAFLIYLICAILFPKDLEAYEGFKDYLLSRLVFRAPDSVRRSRPFRQLAQRRGLFRQPGP
jgi:hypothetical protein